MSQDWNISLRAHQCIATGTEFEDGAVVFSRLRFTEDGYVREDFRADEWDESMGRDALSVWKGVYQKPKARPVEPLRKENAETLLRELIETEDEANLNVIFILAVMLERKRVFVERDVVEREDGMKIRVYEHKATGEMFMIPDPQLKLAEIDSVQEEVLIRLGGEPPGQKAKRVVEEEAESASVEGESS